MKLHHFTHNSKLIKSKAKDPLFKLVGIAMGLSLATFLATYFYTAILTNILDIATYGVYATIISTVFTLYLVLLLGVDQGLIAFVPDMVEKGDLHSVGTYLVYSRHRTIFQLCLIFVVSLFFVLGIYEFHFIPKNSMSVVISYLWICPVGAMLWFIGCYMQARNYANTSLLILDLLPAILLLLVLLIFEWFHLKLDLFGAIIITLLTMVLAFICGWLFCKIKKIIPESIAPLRQATTQWNQKNFDLYIILLVTYTPSTLVIILAQFLSPHAETAAIISVLVTISNIIFVIFSAISAVYTPKISTAVTDLNIATIKSLLTQSTLLTLIAGAIPTFIVIFFGKFWLGQFGKEYLVAYVPLIVITLVNYINIVLSPFQFVAQYSRDLRSITWVALVFFIFFIGLSIVGDRYFDVMGSMLAYGVLFVGFWIYLFFLVVLNWKKLFTATPIQSS